MDPRAATPAGRADRVRIPHRTVMGQRTNRLPAGPATTHRPPTGQADRGPGRTVRHLPGLREFLPTEIALALRIAESTANVHLDEATDLMHRLPDTFTALDSGRITAVKAATIRLHSKDLDTEKSALLERDVLRAAPTQTVPELRDTVRRSVLRRDPTGADQRHAKEKYQRRITRHHKPDGMAGLWILSTAQDIAAIDTCATALGQASRAPDDGRTAQARAVDALTDICTHILDTGSWNTQTLPTNHRRRPHLHVTVPLDALQPNNTSDDTDHPTTTHTSSQNTNSTSGDTDHPTTTDPGTTDAGSTDNPTHTGTTTDTTGRGGYLAGYGPISRSQTLAIAVNATWRRLVCDPLTGTLLDYGRTTYTPPTALADHIIARDNTCYLPGCRQPAHLADIDHITPYQPGQPTGGHTVDTNLGAGCRHHHRAKDGGEFHLERATNGDYHWITPLGRNYTKPATPLWQPPPPEPAHRPILPIPERPQTPPPPPKPTRNPGDPPF